MNVLDLFSGIGGLSLGLERAGMTTVAFCEIEPFPQSVLRKNFPGVPIYDDVRKLTAEILRADGIDTIDLVCGGFPCQPFSVAGDQRGKHDDRFLWPEMLRIIKGVKPRWVIGENVAGFVNMALDDCVTDLENAGYEVQPFVIPACAVNAPHRRDRVWIVAHSNSDSQSVSSIYEQRQVSRTVVPDDAGSRWNHTSTPEAGNRNSGNCTRQEIEAAQNRRCGVGTGERITNQWDAEPGVGRVAYGIPNGVDRLKALGNTVVPQIPEIIGRAIMKLSTIESET